jgi:hypothetical protein
MKTLVKLLVLSTAFLLLNAGLFINRVNAQTAPPPPPPSEKGFGGNQGPMDNAPLGDGAWILVALVIGYGVHTYTKYRKNEPDKD